ncbi:DUF6310 domain-containing protein [Corallococcus sp. BB11-1]|uniref:DUF6310 domain-containing protein n=1 Tax=Corallococcus sp. BB11-1 TaxID=2996783 RepID=UPI002270CB23|nr:DUF6310 domain-containing protein [Corallococcus sp. BB11-1]MCY1033431.1 DUF6310 domain-containing protein [Corallococcus sp. BB11-1]
MHARACIALLLILSACATSGPSPGEAVARSPRNANLQRAAALPWEDEGRCVVQEASHPWPEVVEQCFHALDQERIRFRDPTGRCAVASAGAAAMGIGFCVLAAPEIIVGAVIVVGVVVVGIAIKEALDAYELKRADPEDAVPVLETKPAPREAVAERRPKPQPAGQDWLPPMPPDARERERRPECKPLPVPHLGGDVLHNMCADRVPRNGFPGSDVLVNGKRFDALQLHARVLWEVKTDNFDTFSVYLQRTVPEKQVQELRRERDLALACGFEFRVGVRSAAHKVALDDLDGSLEIVVMDWC